MGFKVSPGLILRPPLTGLEYSTTHLLFFHPQSRVYYLGFVYIKHSVRPAVMNLHSVIVTGILAFAVTLVKLACREAGGAGGLTVG